MIPREAQTQSNRCVRPRVTATMVGAVTLLLFLASVLFSTQPPIVIDSTLNPSYEEQRTTVGETLAISAETPLHRTRHDTTEHQTASPLTHGGQTAQLDVEALLMRCLAVVPTVYIEHDLKSLANVGDCKVSMTAMIAVDKSFTAEHFVKLIQRITKLRKENENFFLRKRFAVGELMAKSDNNKYQTIKSNKHSHQSLTKSQIWPAESSSRHIEPLSSLKSSSKVFSIRTEPHPSCIAEQLVRMMNPSESRSESSPSSSDRDLPLPSDVEMLAKYRKPKYNCYKHGGHEPGVPRRGVDSVSNKDNAGEDHERHLLFQNVLYYKGELYLVGGGAGGQGQRERKLFNYAPSFSMIKGNWPQPIFGNISVITGINTQSELEELLGQKSASGGTATVTRVPLGYWQPPTDFNSHYHTFVEQTMPAFHSLLAHHERETYGSITTVERIMNQLGLSPWLFIEPSRWPELSPVGLLAKSRGLLWPPSLMVTSRPRKSGFTKAFVKGKMSCHFPPTVEEEVAFNASGSSSLINSKLTGTTQHCLDTMLGRMTMAAVGQLGVYGLSASHSQFADPVNVGSAMGGSRDSETWSSNDIPAGLRDRGGGTFSADEPLFFDSLLVGNPTHCEPLWGADPFYAELLAQDQYLRGVKYTRRLFTRPGPVKSNDEQENLPNEHIQLFETFTKSFDSCQNFLWSFRNYYLQSVVTERGLRQSQDRVVTDLKEFSDSGSINMRQGLLFSLLLSGGEDHSSPVVDSTDRRGGKNAQLQPSIIPAIDNKPIDYNAEPIRILFTSRKGDWARLIVNEGEVVEAIRNHLKTKEIEGGPNSIRSRLYREATVTVIKFTDKKLLRHQLHNELKVKETTMVIGNHGANYIPTLFLRPNAAVLTMSFATPGYYPFSVFPKWLHFRDLMIEQYCNKRLHKGKCKWSSGNNNDMLVSKPHQMSRLLELIDDVIEEQLLRPRSGL